MNTLEGSRVRRAQVAVTTAVAAIAVIVYGAYGDPNPKSDQQAAVPFLIAVVVLVAGFVYGWLLPRSARSGRVPARTARAALAHSVVGLLLVPAAFWSGLPIVLGGAGMLLGSQVLRAETDSDSGPGRAAVVTGGLAVGADVIMILLSNTVL